MAKAPNGIIAFYECLGTMILVSTVVFVVTSGKLTANVAPAFVIPLGLFVAITIGGPVTGGHFNPMITLALNLAGAMTPCQGAAKGTPNWGLACVYWCA